jgi:23S rRNA (uracil1939-C5)-methyltransferase
MVKKRDEIVVEIESAAFEGAGVARLDNQVVFIPYGVPGDRVRAVVTRKKKRHLEAAIQEVVRPSPDRIEPRCKHFGICGGCSWQCMRYDAQLEFKRKQVQELLERIGGLSSVTVEPTVPCPEPFYYRNKMEFSFGVNRWLTREEIDSGKPLTKGFALGLHIPKRFDKILDLDVCYLQADPSVAIMNRVREIALEEGWTCHNSRSNSGYLRHLVLRIGQGSGDLMVNLVTTSHEPERIALFTKALLSEFPVISTVVNSVNSSRSPIASGEMEHVSFGDGTIREEIGSLVFEIAPTSFFQPNTAQAERLVSTISRFLDSSHGQTVYDLFCGLGTIGLSLSDQVGKVVGIENNETSVEMARKNCQINGIDNCIFQVGDAAEALASDFMRSFGKPDRLVLDPPRPGLHPKLCEAILRAKPERIVYTSCNPATQARDLKLLSGAYEIERVQPIDMFPQTYHIEAVAALQLRSVGKSNIEPRK